MKSMKRRRSTLVDLHYDLLKEILIRVAESSNGANGFAKAMSVCKAFRQFVKDEDVLEAVKFDDSIISDRWELFQMRGGLICRCAQAGHSQAQFILGKIILVSTSQLLNAKKEALDMEEAFPFAKQAGNDNLPKATIQVSSFMEDFSLDRTHPHSVDSHFHFVKLFLSRARSSDFQEMRPYLNDYISYFVRCKEYDQLQLLFLRMLFIVKGMAERWQEKLTDYLKKIRCRVFEWMDIFEVPIELGKMVLMEGGSEGEGQCFHYSAKTFGMLLKCLSAMEEATDEVTKAAKRSAKENGEDASFALSFFHAFFIEARELEGIIKTWKSIASCVEESLAGILSEFECLLFCKITTEHRHNTDAPYSTFLSVIGSIAQA